MASLDFTSMQMIINEQEPTSEDLRLCFSNSAGDSHHEVFGESLGNGLYWLYLRFGQQYPYSGEVIDASTKTIGKNPRDEKQIELNQQLFCMYSEQLKTLYTSKKNKIKLEAYFNSALKTKRCRLKNFYKNPEDFFQNIVSVGSIKLISKDDLFNPNGNAHSMEQDPINIFGFGAPVSWEITADYKRKNVTEELKNKFRQLFSDFEKGKVAKLTCQGYDDSGIEQIFNTSGFLSRITLSRLSQDRGCFDAEEVKCCLATKLKGQENV